MTETARDSSTPRDPASLVIGAIAAQVIGGLVPQMSPFVIGGLMDGLSLSERDAGFIIFVEFLALAVTAIAIAPVLPRVSYRRVAGVAVALTLLAQGASIFSASAGSLTLLRGLAGVGEGALYAVSLSIVCSRSSNPDKVYGYFQVVWALGSVALFAIGGQLTAAFTHRGILSLIAGVTLALAPLLFLIPDARAKSGDGTAADVIQASPLLGVMTLAAIGLYLTVSAAIYAFSAPLRELAGLDTTAVGYALTVASLVGLAGAGAATALNVRWGRAIPITGFCVGFSLITLALCLWHNPTAYVVALVVSVVIYYFSIPYLFGLAAELDRSGRWAAAAGSAYLLGFAAGPLVAGAAIAAAGYASLAAVCVAITAAAWGLVMGVIRRLSRAARVAQPIDVLA
ncbi:MFS transporter [Phyllobacterium zundukense]|uniref:Arabinose ABC transporter permease n=1 Tax=Phyllobacterium zundukense TaxID=1867719 RepID=A0A2N9W0F3_9HYPH|nr:MFS transporter [Phyllobacterium zundukense]ATU90539.1 arabinose ABC transporter permease [Phyllobacterium zundukense]PIO45221.1 arabinose ABC transporter permease [Phyllobacterium zundukense]